MSTDALRNMLLTARMQSRLAAALYGRGEGLNALASKVGAMPLYFETGSVAAGALVFGDHVHLSICGSDDKYDWAINSNRDLQKLELLHVHQGYFDASRWISQKLVERSFFDFCSHRRLYCGGHSAGGAIAELLAMRTRHLAQPTQVFTFGAPKWCSRLSAALYSAFPWETYRFTMSGDPVPYLPLNGWRQLLGRPGFAHTAPGMEVSDDGDVLSVDGMTMVRRLYCTARHVYRHGVFGVLASLGNLRDTINANHGIERYRAAIYLASGRY